MRQGRALELRILGPLEVDVDGKPAGLGPRVKQLLVTLLAKEGQLITGDRLTEWVWGYGTERKGPKPALRANINHLREALDPGRRPHDDSVIKTEPYGYRLKLPHGLIDAYRFRTLHSEGQSAWDAGNPRHAAARFSAALELWRGDVLQDVDIPVHIEGFAAQLGQERRAAHEMLIEARVALGHHVDVLPELAELVRDDPANERLRLVYSLAAYRSGRIGLAADICRVGITLLAQSGLESPALRRQQEQILNRAMELDWAALTGPPAPAIPQPPPAPADFTDRDVVLGDMITRFHAGWDAGQATVFMLSGMAGVGKTSAALRVAERVRDWFPDGILCLYLHGMREHPKPPAVAQADILRALGITEPPGDPAERTELLHEMLTGRRMLMILDDAADEAQVSPLLPRRGPCAALVTSRQRLAVDRLPPSIVLDVLDPVTAREYLARRIRGERAEREEGADAELGKIAELCGYLPLALNIINANLAARPHRSLARQIERLEHNRLNALQYGESPGAGSAEDRTGRDVRATLELSYLSLGELEQRTFRLLGLLEAPTFATWAAASLLSHPVGVAAVALDNLVAARLLDVVPEKRKGQPRYRCHVLVHEFAKEKAEQDPGAPTALVRSLWSHLWLARRAQAALDPDTDPPADDPLWAASTQPSDAVSVGQPMDWFSDERGSMAAAVRAAHQARQWRLTWQLTAALTPFFDILALTDEWAETHDLAMDAVGQSGDAEGRAWTHCGLGLLRRYQGRLDAAADAFAEARQIFIARGERFGHARALCGYGDILLGKSQFDAATDAFTQGLQVFRELGKQAGEASALASLGEACGRRGEWHQAISWSGQSVRLSRALGDRRGQVSALRDLGVAHRELRQLRQAAEAFGECLQINEQLGDRRGIAATLISYGMVREAEGSAVGRSQARHQYLQAAAIFGELHDERWEAIAHQSLGASYLDAGDAAHAIPHLDEAVNRLRHGQDQWQLAQALRQRGRALSLAGDVAGAQAGWREAHAILTRIDPRQATEIESLLAEERQHHG